MAIFTAAASGAASFASGFVSELSSGFGLFQSYDPVRHAERIAAIDDMFRRALQGDYPAEIHLRCWAGEKTAEAIAFGYVDAAGTCRVGDDSALAYAKRKLAELELRKAGAKAAGGLALIGAGTANELVPGSGTGAVLQAGLANFLGGKTFGLPTPLVVAAVGIGAYLLVRRL